VPLFSLSSAIGSPCDVGARVGLSQISIARRWLAHRRAPPSIHHHRRRALSGDSALQPPTSTGVARRVDHAGALGSIGILTDGELEAINDVPYLAVTNGWVRIDRGVHASAAYF
jgi:hypothetical protein